MREAEQHPFSSKMRASTERFFNSIVLRDPYNLFASRLRILRERSRNANFNNLLLRDKETGEINLPHLWKEHAKEFLGITRELQGKPLHINYNQWLVDFRYREEISNSLGLPLTDDCKGQVPGYGFGSSFDNRRFDGSANEMKLMDRWKSMQQDPVFRSLVMDEELRALAHEIYGEVVSGPVRTQILGGSPEKSKSKRKLVATMKIGDVHYSKHTLSGIRDYARRCEADFHLIKEKDPRYEKCFSANKFQALTKLVEENYDTLLLLDLDILISPTAPNIFEQHSKGLWAMPAFEGMRKRYLSNLDRYLGKIPISLDASSYANAGVILIDRATATKLLPLLEPPLGPWTEQGILHWACHQAGIPLHALAPEWNCMERLCATTPNPHVVHIAGKKKDDHFRKRVANLAKAHPALGDWIRGSDFATEQMTPSQPKRGFFSPKT
jgi:hypothetical protein